MKSSVVRIVSIAMLSFMVGLVSPASSADEWPSKAVKIVVGNPPAGSADRFGRLLAGALSKQFDEQFYVENRPGNSGAIAAAQVARAEPDGYTLMVGSSGPHVSAPLIADVGYDPVADFTHIAMIGGDTYVLATNPQLGVKSLAELLALA
jgi:tripartite-type tricarboxylate transporter receptor subunit TctC